MTLTVHTLDEAATILRVKPHWLERQAAARKIPFTMLGGSYRFTSEHLTAIVTLHENRPAPVSSLAPERRIQKPRNTPSTHALQAKPLRPRTAHAPRRAA